MIDVSEALWDMTERIQFSRVSKTVEDFEVVEGSREVAGFDGALQPMPARKLLVKPEGQRGWKWWTLWTEERLDLDDVVEDLQKKQYRVMTQADWRAAGYFEYEVAEGVPGE